MAGCRAPQERIPCARSYFGSFRKSLTVPTSGRRRSKTHLPACIYLHTCVLDHTVARQQFFFFSQISAINKNQPRFAPLQIFFLPSLPKRKELRIFSQRCPNKAPKELNRCFARSWPGYLAHARARSSPPLGCQILRTSMIGLVDARQWL